MVYYDLEKHAHFAFMKGAPECVLDACTFGCQGDILTPESKTQVLHLMDRFASDGLVRSLTPSTLIIAGSGTGLQKLEDRRKFLS